MPNLQTIYNPSMNKLVRDLLAQMEDAGFSNRTLEICLRTLRPIQEFMELHNVTDYSPDVGNSYLKWFQEQHDCNRKRMNMERRYVGLLNDCYQGIPIVRKKTAEIRNDSLKQYLEGLLDQLKRKGYSEETVHNYWSRLRPIQNYMRDNNIEEYTPEIGLDYFKNYLMRNHPGTVHKRGILAAIHRLNDYCSGSDYKRRHDFCEKPSIPESFSVDVQRFFASPQIVTVKERTINRRINALARFLTKCDRCGVSNIKNLTPDNVILACKDVPDIDDWITIRQFLRFLAQEGVTENDLSTLVPKERRQIPVPSTYSIEELRSIEAAVDRNTYQGKRDYVILLMADRLAIRSGDIAGMKLENLDFATESISFIQEKTNNEVVVPMIQDLREALKTYLKETNTEDGYLFHSLHAPHNPLRSGAINSIVNRYFRISGIETFGKKHGPHSLRASVSTSMINDDVPYEAVKDLLGQRSPNAIRHYAKNDIEKLRRCAIPVPVPSGNFLEFLEGSAKK